MRRGTARALAAVLTCGFALAGCSGGSDDEPAGTGASSSPSATAEVTTTAEVTKVTGKLDAAGRDALAQAVTSVVDQWMDGAYLGDFPRTDYSAAFAGFTTGAAAKAQRNLALMTNSGISDRIETAEATRRSVSLDVLSVKQKPVGVTATVDLAFDTAGTLAGAQEVTGTLDLTPDGAGWKVFGFEISRSAA
jgi:hypothetical protein